jgi:hypothetical protein
MRSASSVKGAGGRTLRRCSGRCRAVAARAAPQDGAHARQQLARGEGLGDVVVGAELEADHAVDLVAARSEEEHRHLGAAGFAVQGLQFA